MSTMKGGGNARHQKRQLKIQQLLQRRKARLRLQQANPGTVVSTDMIQDELANSQCKRIVTMLPTFHNKSKKIFARNAVGNKQYAVGQAIRALPTSVLKKHVGWLSMKQQDAKSDLSLTEEIESFANYVGLTEAEQEVRKVMLADMEEAVRVRWSDAVVVPFGSYAAGLSIFFSDIDAAVLSAAANAWILRPTHSDESDEEDLEQMMKRPRLASTDGSASDNLNKQLFGSDHVAGPVTDANEVEFLYERNEAPEEIAAVDEMSKESEDNGDENEVEIVWEINRTTTTNQPTVSAASGQNTSETITLQPPKIGEKQIGTVVPSTSLLGKRRRRDSSISDDSDEEDSVEHKDVSDIEDSDDDDEESLGLGTESDDELSTGDSESTHSSDLYGVGEKKRATIPTRIDVHIPPEKKMNSSSYKRFSDDENETQHQESTKELPMDLDISITHPTQENIMALPQEAMDFTNYIDLTHLSPSLLPYSKPKNLPHENKQRHRKIQVLRYINQMFRILDWTDQVELRHRAKVPIIHYTHRCGVDGDISLGLNEDDTLRLAQAMVNVCGQKVLFQLSSFLKIFLHQLQLDEPFTGGLGSFKLYVLITAHCQKHLELLGKKKASNNAENDYQLEEEEEDEEEEANTGLLLLTFFQYYGRSSSLNADTNITLTLPSISSPDQPQQSQSQSHQERVTAASTASHITASHSDITVTINFEVNTMIHLVQRAFAVAYSALRDACREKGSHRKQQHNATEIDSDVDNESDAFHPHNILNNHATTLASHNAHQVSHSLLARLLVSCQSLQQQRTAMLKQTSEYLRQRGTDSQRLQRAQLLLQYIQTWYLAQKGGGSDALVTWDQCDLALQTRLLSFVDPQRAFMGQTITQSMKQAFESIVNPDGSQSTHALEDSKLAALSELPYGYQSAQALSSSVQQYQQTKKHRSRPKSLPGRVNSMSSLASMTSMTSTSFARDDDVSRHSSKNSNRYDNNNNRRVTQSFNKAERHATGFGRHNIPQNSSPVMSHRNNYTVAPSPQKQHETMRELSSQIDASIAVLKEKLREKKQQKRTSFQQYNHTKPFL